MPTVAFNVFESSTALVVPGVLALVFVLLFIPSLMVTGARAEQVARAISCIILKALGFLMIATSAVQLGIALATLQILDEVTFFSLGLFLVIGIGLMVHASMLLHRLDDASSMVSRLVFTHTLEALGVIVVLSSGLSILLSMLATDSFAGLEVQAVLLLLGIMLLLGSSVHIREKNKRALKKKR